MLPDLKGVRLLVVGDWPPPLGGVSVHVRALTDAARKAGALVSVIDIGKGQNAADGVHPSGKEAVFLGQLFARAGLCDVVHLHTSGANPKSWILAALVGLAAKAARKRAVVTFHSGHGPRYLHTTPRAVAARAALALFDRVVCVNEEISRALTRLGAADGRHVVAPAFGKEGVVPGALPSGVRAFHQQHGKLVSAMLAPGRDYGARELFAAFALLRKQLPEAALAVYGPSSDSAETQSLAKELGADPVLFLGQIERPEALALMKESDLFVRPTLVDGDAVSVREALSLAVPVVATRVGNRPPGVRLCAPASETDLARQMEAALRAPAGEGPRVSGEGSDGIEQVLELYARLVGRPTIRMAA